MPIMQWEDRFSVGVASIDGQHKRLVGMINQLHDAMVGRQVAERLGQIVDEMADYAATHFATEELLMRRFAYVDYASHRREHEAFTGRVVDLQRRLASGSLVLSIEVINFLRDWLTNHIMVVDKGYSPCFTENGLLY